MPEGSVPRRAVGFSDSPSRVTPGRRGVPLVARRARLRRPQTGCPATSFTLPTCIRTVRLASCAVAPSFGCVEPVGQHRTWQRNVEHRTLPDADLRALSQSSDELLEPAQQRARIALLGPDVHGAGAEAPARHHRMRQLLARRGGAPAAAPASPLASRAAIPRTGLAGRLTSAVRCRPAADLRAAPGRIDPSYIA